MLSLTLAQLALAAATTLASPPSPTFPVIVPPAPVEVTVTAGPNDVTALDILNNTRRDILAEGAAHRCQPVTTVYVDGRRRTAPVIDHGFSSATLYFAGDTVMVMLPPDVADALRTIPAKSVRDIRYADCTTDSSATERNVLFVTTK